MSTAATPKRAVSESRGYILLRWPSARPIRKLRRGTRSLPAMPQYIPQSRREPGQVFGMQSTVPTFHKSQMHDRKRPERHFGDRRMGKLLIKSSAMSSQKVIGNWTGNLT